MASIWLLLRLWHGCTEPYLTATPKTASRCTLSHSRMEIASGFGSPAATVTQEGAVPADPRRLGILKTFVMPPCLSRRPDNVLQTLSLPAGDHQSLIERCDILERVG